MPILVLLPLMYGFYSSGDLRSSAWAASSSVSSACYAVKLDVTERKSLLDCDSATDEPDASTAIPAFEPGFLPCP